MSKCKAKKADGSPCNTPVFMEGYCYHHIPNKGVPKNIIEFMKGPARSLFKDLNTWCGWMTFFKALYGLPMIKEEKEVFEVLAERETIPEDGFKEAYCIVGRRGGKSYSSAFIAVYTALYGDFQEHLAPGEKCHIFCVAVDRRQASIVLNYIKGILSLFPKAVEKELKWEIHLNNSVVISVQTCTFRGSRGYSTALLILDELAFYRDANSASPADEVITSLLPGLLPGGLLIGISTPYGKFGTLYQTFKSYFGTEHQDILVIRASTKAMNPNYSDELIERLLRRDKKSFSSEYNAEFREDLETFLGETDLMDVTDEGKIVIPHDPQYRYLAFVDPSGGKRDSYTLAIGHVEEEIFVLDLLKEVQAPFDPQMATEKFCYYIKSFKIHRVFGDRFGGNWVSNSYRKHGLVYEAISQSKSELYLTFQALVRMKKVRILDDERLRLQLQSLEVRTRSGGLDSVDHPDGFFDDYANACAGCLVLLHSEFMPNLSTKELMARLPRMSGHKYSKADLDKAVEEKEMEERVLASLREKGIDL